MKKFRIQIRAYDYAADFQISAEDNREAIEKAILDKLGQNDVKWEKDGFSDSSRRKWITYEEVINDSRPIHYETVLGTRVASRAPEGGQI
jgi:hypothetical protein|tara:strand:+ start:958 stop:1227 length:270 start_codon:yes stop_codon:yes gene_type:complete